jgi:hypothetical protein
MTLLESAAPESFIKMHDIVTFLVEHGSISRTDDFDDPTGRESRTVWRDRRGRRALKDMREESFTEEISLEHESD